MSVRMEMDIEGLARGLEKDLAKQVTADVRAVTEAMKADLREMTSAAFNFSNRLPKAWRSEVYPRTGDSVDAAGVVRVTRTAADIIESALAATTIRARGGKWLAIPAPEAGRFGLKAGRQGGGATTAGRGNRERVTPEGWERRTGLKLRFVPGKRPGTAYLVADQAMYTRGSGGRVPLIKGYSSRGRGSKLYGPAGRTLLVFTLVRVVTTRKRIDLDAVATRAADRGARVLLSNWKG